MGPRERIRQCRQASAALDSGISSGPSKYSFGLAYLRAGCVQCSRRLPMFECAGTTNDNSAAAWTISKVFRNGDVVHLAPNEPEAFDGPTWNWIEPSKLSLPFFQLLADSTQFTGRFPDFVCAGIAIYELPTITVVSRGELSKFG